MSFLNFLPLIDKGIDFVTGLVGHDKQKDTAKDLANWQNTNEVKFWQMNNEYNSPVNQMARLQEAGINPNLAFSNGQLSNVSTSSPRSASHQSVNSPSFGNSSFVDSFLQVEQIKNAQAQNKVITTQAQALEAQALKDKAAADELIARTYGIRFDNKLKDQVRNYLVDSYALANEEISTKILLNVEQQQLASAQKMLTATNQKLTQQQTINLRRQLSLLDAQIAETYNRIQVGNSTINLNNNHSAVLTQQEFKFKLENSLLKSGLTPNDPLYSRILFHVTNNPKQLQAIILALEGGKSAAKIASDFIPL